MTLSSSTISSRIPDPPSSAPAKSRIRPAKERISGGAYGFEITGPPHAQTPLLLINDHEPEPSEAFVGAQFVSADGFRVQAAVLGVGGTPVSIEQIVQLVQVSALTW